jgi:hypothetical protein
LAHARAIRSDRGRRRYLGRAGDARFDLALAPGPSQPYKTAIKGQGRHRFRLDLICAEPLPGF